MKPSFGKYSKSQLDYCSTVLSENLKRASSSKRSFFGGRIWKVRNLQLNQEDKISLSWINIPYVLQHTPVMVSSTKKCLLAFYSNENAY